MNEQLDKENVQDIFELNMIQKGMLFHHLNEVTGNLYNVQLALLFEGTLQTEVFIEAFRIVQSKNESLRSVFRWNEVSRPIQIVLKQCPAAILVHDYSAYDRTESAAMVEDFINKDQQERFDLTQLPVRMAIIRTAPASYIIVLSHHHILYDGWSTAIMLEELFSAYSQLTSNQEVDIVDKPSYKMIRQAVKRNEAAEEDSGYWREYLKDYEITSLFPERHGSSEPFAIKRMEFQAPKERLEAFASTHKVTKATIIYAAYGLLLQQYGNMPDIVFGTTVSDRSAAIRGHDRVMGNFINTIPLRITASGDKTLLEVVSALNEELLVRNQLTSTSYAGIKNMLGLKVSDDLFDCLIVIENYPLGEQLIKSLSTFNIKIKSVYGNAGIPLVATVFFGEELIFELSYMDNIISEDFAASFGKRLVKLTEEILSNPNRKAASVSLLSDEEENWLTNEFNATKTGYALDETVLTLFNNQADRTPEKTAIITGGKSISYRELQEISSRMASYLETVAGVKPGEGVGIMLEREEMLVPSILGVLATGAAYIPIDPEYPPHRVRNIIDSSGLKVLITRSKQAEGITVLDLDHCTGDILRQSPALLTRKASSNDVAYVIYTSGSTGTPKGCAITHRNLSNYLQWANAYYFGENEYGNCGLITSISFDLTVTCLFVPLIKGRKLFIGDGGKDIAGLLKDCFGNPEIDTIKLTPSHLSLLQGLNITNTNVRVIICGGEQLTKEQLNIVWNINKDIRIYNEYGPTETTVGSIVLEMKPDDKKILIGRPIANTEIYILQEDDRLTPTEMTGEICIAGAGVGNGYWGQPVLTSEKFVGNPFKPGEKMYRTGDLGRLLSNGYIECLGRKDDQVKIRGFRIELQEIEAQLSEFEGIRQVRVIVRQKDGDKYIVAYYLSDNEYNGAVLKDYLLKKLPAYMIPAFFVRLESIPVNSNGKLDRKLLPEPQIPSDGDYQDVAGDVEAAILQIWLEVLGHDRISTNVNFFDIGGDSLKLISVYSKVKSSFDVDMQFTDLFDYPTITALADFIKSGMPQDKVPQQENAGVFDTGVMQAASTAPVSTNTDLSPVRDQDIAIIGMAGRFPGAATIAEFWENLKAGIDSITVDKKEADPATLVRAKAHLREYDAFDAAFFNYIPSEAANMDPQLRIFHECVWEAFEDAGYRPGNHAGSIGLYGGASPNPCYNINIDDNDKEGWLEKWEVMSYADKDFMCPRVSYKLNLKGPSINVTTACSTSLVAVAMACNDLLANNCDMAAAGGVSVTMHDNDGYLYRKDMILSPDGRCRAFDEDAAGTVGGNGAGVVVLKRYADAIRDGDHINAVIKGTAINNDGNQKVGFTAPGIEGQSRVIDAAIRSAGISAESISYIETHGTATLLGDPIEVAGLMKAFNTDKRQFCAIGSVKSNIGHLDAAAGIAGLIKAVLSLKHKLIPPSLHFKKANPHIDFANSPFYVNTQPSYWKNGQYPRRAGVSSFGIGGTNAHVILEEVLVNDSISHDSYQLITLSAKTPAALSGNRAKLLNYLRKPGEASLADIAFTLQVGREPFKYRDTFVCSTREEAIGLLSTRSDDAVPQMAPAHQPDVVFMFSGQGAQYAHMYRGIYDNQKYFRDTADECFAIVNRIARIDLKAIIFPGPDGADQLKSTAYTQPALFIMEYALAKLLSHWGIRPDIMIGHSIGEYVAACLSGVFSLEDALKLVTTRGALMQSMPKGSMLAIAARQQELIPLLDEHSGISLAAINSPAHCVVSGPSGSIALFAEVLKAHGWEHRELHTSHAFHSSMMDEILSSFEEVVSAVTFFPINIPFISNYTGKRALDKEVSTPAYWVQHLRREVRFAEGMETILKKGPALLVELGPGNALATFVRASDAFGKEHTVINMVRHSKQDTDDMKWLLKGIGEMWMLDIQPDWIAWHQEENRKRVPLPTYSFEKTPFPATIQKTARVNEMENNRVIERNPDISKWLYVPGWRTTPNLAAIRKNSSVDPAYSGFLIFSDGQPFSARLIEKLTSTNTSFALVVNGTTYQEAPDNCYILDADSDNDYNKLFDSLSQKAFKYDNIVYIRTTPGDPAFITSRLAQIVRSAYGNGSLPRKQIVLLTAGLHNVLGDEPVSPSLAPVSGLLKVIPQEYSGVYTSHIDISAKEAQRDYAVREIDADAFLNKLLDEIGHREQGKSVALRNSKRWVPVFEWLFEQPGSASVLHDLPVKIRHRGVYLITGGLGDLGFTLSKYLINKYNTRLILLGRTALTPDEANGFRIMRMRELEQMGGDVLYVSCDIADAAAVKEAVNTGESKFGMIDGVIHAAGISGAEARKTINIMTRADLEYQFAAKATGLQILKDLFDKRKPDFCLATSSISVILGGLGFGVYTPANTFMDHLINAFKNSTEEDPWISVGLDGLDLKKEGSGGITPEELCRLFEHVISLTNIPNIAISVGDLNRRIDKWVRLRSDEKASFAGDNSKPSNAAEKNLLQSDTKGPGTEERLLNLWKLFFGIADIGVDDDFFGIGGDSLKAMVIISRINKEFNTDLSVSELFTNPTVRELVPILKIEISQMGIANEDRVIQSGHTLIPIAANQEFYPLSSAQKRLFFLSEFDKNNLVYNLTLLLRLKGAPDRVRIQSTFDRLLRRHESLRTCFELLNNDPVQKIADPENFELEYYNASENNLESVFRAFVRPFELDRPPLIRAGLVAVSGNAADPGNSADHYILMVDLHHIIFDGFSESVLIRDFIALYNNEELPALPLQYKDYAQWQQSDEQRQSVSRQKEFWLNEFAEEIPTLQLPFDFPRPSIKSYEGNTLAFELGEQDVRGLRLVAEKEGSTLFMVLLSIYAILLSKLSDQEDIVIGTPVAGRDQADLQPIIGMFVNTIPIRNHANKQLRFQEFLANVKSNTIRCFDNQGYQYEDLIDALRPERDTSHNPLFDVLFSYGNFSRPELVLPDLSLERLDYPNVGSKFDLTLTVNDIQDRLFFTFEYCTKLFKKETIERFEQYFRKIVTTVTATPHVLLKDIELLDEAAKRRLLVKFNATELDDSEGATIVSLFEEQVKRTPHKIAVVYEDMHWTYQELNESANRVAFYLREQAGIKREDLVGIMVSRSGKMMAGLLGILKAGGAYLPIDPAYPKQRVEHMLTDSGAAILITDKGRTIDFAYNGKGLLLEDILNAAGDTAPAINKPDDLCYVMYTSGSTGLPKGVMITHGAVVNFFQGMSRKLPAGETDCLLAVTSTSFDISVLELFWTICNGIQVIVHPSDISLNGLDRYVDTAAVSLDFSLFFFSSYSNDGDDKYDLLLDSVKYADKQGFKAVWTPERHFHEFGGLFPNPSVLSSALAMITEKIELRSGSVVLPLHDEIRIAEEWSVVDNLSNGRVALSFASGWNPNDFILSEDNFKDRQTIMYEKIRVVKDLWRGEKISRVNGFGSTTELRIFPEPVQKELPVWITSGGSADTFISAGAIGANILTHLLGQDIDSLAKNIQLYRGSRAKHGFDPEKGKVAIMLHTYIGEQIEEVEKIVEQPFMEYLESSLGLSKVLFEEEGIKEEELPEEDRARVLKSAFKRYYTTSSLIGTKSSCGEILMKLAKAGVDEIACLVDFGIDKNKVMEGLQHLSELKRMYAGIFPGEHQPVTMMQSTPSFINLLEKDPGSKKFLGSLKMLLIGGEAVPESLMRNIRAITRAAVFNMYGPTETTIWSCVHAFDDNEDKVSIGKPIANTQIYILNKELQPVPIGVTGDLYIGGRGLSRGYWNKPALTAQRFIDNPFRPGSKMYLTGDVARWTSEGNLEFLGRSDHQVKIRGYRIELGEIEHTLLTYPMVREAIVDVREKEGVKQLTAYLAADPAIDLVALRTHLADSLPPYMIPAHFVIMDRLPLTSNGKVNRKALPDPQDNGIRNDFEAPGTENERLLAEVWSKVLGVGNISITDNFFSLGGDSIKSIQIISRMRNAGYEISAKDIFISQTIRMLAQRVKKTGSVSDQSFITGTGSLTPIQRWYFDGISLDAHHYNQAVMLLFPNGISRDIVYTIFRKIQEHHDALRMVFKEVDGSFIPETRGPDLPVAISESDLRKEQDQAWALNLYANKVQSGIDLATGPLMQLGLFHMHDGSRLLIAIHHLVVDGISWRILFEDIEQLYQQVLHNKPLSLPLKTDSFQSWPGHLSSYMQSKTWQQAAVYWRKFANDFPPSTIDRIPRDYPGGINTGAVSRMETFILDAPATIRLLTEAHHAFNTRVNDLMLTALFLSVKKLYKHTSLMLDLEGHGREDIGQGINISRTVGWFTSIFRILIEGGQKDLSDNIKNIKETLRRIPNAGLDYLLVKYAEGSAASTANPQMSFNYLGQFDADIEGNSFTIVRGLEGDMVSPKASLPYDWDIVGSVTAGELKMHLRYSTAQYREETVHSFMNCYKDSLLEVIDYCCSYGRTELTPSDMSYKGLSIDALDKLQQEYAIKDIYPLTPTQEGILYHSLIDKEASRFNIQTTCLLTGDLNLDAIEKSMNYLMARYDILRTIFLHEGYPQHIQVVLKDRRIGLYCEDIREVFPESSKKELIRKYQLQERARAFDPDRDVLMRLLIIRTGEREYEFIWNYHHLLMDGWCIGILVNEFTTIYQHMVSRTEIRLPSVKPYSHYIEWLGNRDKEASAAFWGQYLAGYENRTGLPKLTTLSQGTAASSYDQKTWQVIIDQEQTQGLNRLSRQYGVTINTILQGCWGILLARYNNTDDVVFGSVVSGRPAEIEGVETMVGLFINTIPVRIKYEGTATAGDFLQELQASALESELYHYHPLSEIQSMREPGRELLDHIIAFENFPIAQQIGKADGTSTGKPFEISNADFFVQGNYDLDITIMPMDELIVQFDFNANRYAEKTIENASAHLKNIISAIVAKPDGLLKDISLYDEREQLALNAWLTADLEQKTTPIQLRLHRSFETHAHRSAIEYRGKQYSYKEIGADAGKIAAAIAGHGIAEGSFVGIFCEDRRWLISSMLGILQSRSAFVPLETTLPASRLTSMISQAGIRYIITDQQQTDCARIDPSGTITWLTIDAIGHQKVALQQLRDYSPEDQIYVYFTSGSTGNPKGVVGRNKGLSHFIEWEIGTFHIDSSFRFSQFVNPGFDAFMRDIFVPLCSGGTICIPEEDNLSTAPKISAWIDRQRINLIHCVPSFFKLFGKGDLKEEQFPALQYVLLAGEKILPYELQEWHQAFGERIRLVNLYGATETTLVKGYRFIESDITGNAIPVRAMPGAQFLIADKEMHISPRGAEGEIYIRTPYRTAGYLDAAATKRSFIVNPYSNNNDDLLYRTGDLGRASENGEIEITGRADQQVKIRGIRIEPDDIRENILRYPEVQDVIVQVKTDKEGEPFICAYIVAGSPLSQDALRDFLQARLPSNMIPAYLIPMAAFPLLENGKIDRKALPEPDARSTAGYIAPVNATEDKLVEIWSEVLKIDKEGISVTKSFIELGGHSLKILLLINKISQHFHVSIPLKVIFDKKNIQNLADYLITVTQAACELTDSMGSKEISL